MSYSPVLQAWGKPFPITGVQKRRKPVWIPEETGKNTCPRDWNYVLKDEGDWDKLISLGRFSYQIEHPHTHSTNMYSKTKEGR